MTAHEEHLYTKLRALGITYSERLDEIIAQRNMIFPTSENDFQLKFGTILQLVCPEERRVIANSRSPHGRTSRTLLVFVIYDANTPLLIHSTDIIEIREIIPLSDQVYCFWHANEWTARFSLIEFTRILTKMHPGVEIKTAPGPYSLTLFYAQLWMSGEQLIIKNEEIWRECARGRIGCVSRSTAGIRARQRIAGIILPQPEVSKGTRFFSRIVRNDLIPRPAPLRIEPLDDDTESALSEVPQAPQELPLALGRPDPQDLAQQWILDNPPRNAPMHQYYNQYINGAHNGPQLRFIHFSRLVCVTDFGSSKP
jgi:hypothetical protein